MKVIIVLIYSTILTATIGYAQTKKHYHVLPVDEQQPVRLELNASSVSCMINSTHNMHAVSIYGFPENKNFDPIKTNIVKRNYRLVELDFAEEQDNFTSSISGKVFSRLNDEVEKPWHIYLSRNIPFSLNLRYGMGNSTVDLSGLAVDAFKINTGSADIRAGYFAGVPNKVQMDTFIAKVDLGVLELEQLNLSHARNVIADVGFGKLLMHYAEKSGSSSHVKASVGAGSMEVVIDDSEIPVIVHINQSLLCKISMLKYFEEVRPNVFVNKSYEEGAESLITFDIDVAMGNVTFRIVE
ncbi:MAG: hypothetical protein ACLFUB_08575 [Cyclobacteriaceae bacterium]